MRWSKLLSPSIFVILHFVSLYFEVEQAWWVGWCEEDLWVRWSDFGLCNDQVGPAGTQDVGVIITSLK